MCDRNRCLQCGQTREQVKRNDTICATVTGYEVIETLDEWDRHHWRDWSNAEFRRMGIHPSLWEENRRTGIYDLEWAGRTSYCMEHGHSYPRPWHPPLSKWVLDMHPPNLCTTCYEEREATDV